MNRSCFNSFLPAVLGAASIALVSSAFTAPANAYGVINGNITIDSTNDVGRTLDPVKWLVPAGTQGSNGTLPVALSTLATIQVKSFTSSALTLGISFNNTTQLSNSLSNASIVSFGFGVSPNATGVSVNGSSVFTEAVVQTGQQMFPGGFKQIDVCVYAANNCSGGNVNQGLQAGQSTTFDITIFSDSFYNSTQRTNVVTLSDFPVKFQTSVGSFESAGVPEPITVFGSGLALGFGALFKRQMGQRHKRAVAKS
ncbi:cistern family PEP-CTERM protein [Aerosakkonemataceae cyanobacterium BLCC-F50]|uniref:Cistern family PEP-CTERM protein n=1 Tax=Floridaenema flaviceps BLCC-F50 TaxID=3153642 RepID=A0ABV4XRU4_9CYAN